MPGCPSEPGAAGAPPGAETSTGKWPLFQRDDAKKKRRVSEVQTPGDCAQYSSPCLELFGVLRQLLGRRVVALRGMDFAQDLQRLS